MRSASSFLVALALGVSVLTPQSAAGQTLDEQPATSNVVGLPEQPPHADQPAEGDQPASVASARTCAGWDVTYALSGMLRISDTPMAAGDGTHAVGPGALVIRFDDRAGAPAGRARMMSFELTEHFAVHPQAVLWNARLVTDARARAIADDAGPIALGTLVGDTLRWESPIRGFRTDGSLTCDGSLCGRFGAPPSGRSPLHVASGAVRFQPLHFGHGGATFEMPYALVSESESPKQRTFLAMAGREVHRACVPSVQP
jgi:hypothetical protein